MDGENSTPALIRAYGELRTEETVKRHKKGQQEIDDTPAEHPQLKEIQQQLTALQQTVTLMLEDKALAKPNSGNMMRSGHSCWPKSAD
jgi:hypothetical protein